MAKLNDTTNETVEIATDEDVYVPVASTDALGVASFNSEDFTVAQDGKVSLINKVAGIQFLGTITAASDNMLTWKISEYSDGDIEAPVAGDKIMLLESIAFNYDEDTSSYVVNEDSVTTGDLVFIGGGIYVLTSVQAYDTSTLEPVYTNTEYISLLKGGADGVDGIDGTDGADANVKVGTVTTNTVYSTTANVSVTGTTSNHITTLDFTFDVPNVGEKGEDGSDGKDGTDGSDGADGAPAYAGKVGVLGYDVESVNFTDVTWINYTPTTDLECVIYLSEYSDDTKETIVTELCVGKVLYEVGLVMISDKVVISGADATDIDTSLFVTKTEFPEAVAGLIESDITERIDQGTLIGENEYNDLIAGTSILNLSDASLSGTILTLADIEMTNALDLHLGYELSTDKTQISYVMSVNNNYTESIPLSIATDKTNYQVQLTVGDGTDAAVISAAVPKVSFASSSTGGGIQISDDFGVSTTLYPVVNSTGGITFATSYTTDQNVLSKATSIFDNYALSSTVTTNYNTLNNKFSDYVAVDNLASYFKVDGDVLYVNSNEIGAVTVDMSDYVDNDTFNTTISKYLLIDTASSTYATQTTVTNNYNTLNNKFNDYLLASALTDYTKTDDLASIIADKVEAYNYTTLTEVAKQGYLTKSIFGTYDSLAEYLSGNNYVTDAVTDVSTGDDNGTIIVKTASNTTGTAVSVAGLGSAAYTASTAYAAASVADTVSSLSSTVSSLSTKVSTLESAGTGSGSTYSLSATYNSQGYTQVELTDASGDIDTVYLYPYVNSSTGLISIRSATSVPSSIGKISDYISLNSSTNVLTVGTDKFTSSGISSVSLSCNSSTGYLSINIDGITAGSYISSYVENIAMNGVDLSNYATKDQVLLFDTTYAVDEPSDSMDESYLAELNDCYAGFRISTDTGRLILKNPFIDSATITNTDVSVTKLHADTSKWDTAMVPLTAYPCTLEFGTTISAGLCACQVILNPLAMDQCGISESTFAELSDNTARQTAIDSLSMSGITFVDEMSVYLSGTSYIECGALDVSDKNLKNTIEDLSDKYETLFDNLRPVSFKYNNGSSNRLHTGFIAQEVASALTTAELTTQDFAGYAKNSTSGTCFLRYTEFIALCVQKIQKLDARVKVLEAANSDFESRIAALEAKLSE